MRQRLVPLCAGILSVFLSGCTSLMFPDGSDSLTAVLGATETAGGDSPSPPSTVTSDATPAVSSGARTLLVAGRLAEQGDYELFDLGPGQAGDRWEVIPQRLAGSAYAVALFDDDLNLLRRAYVASTAVRLVHTLRYDTPRVIVGVMAPLGPSSGQYRFVATVEPDRPIPSPTPQVVWLNFEGGVDVRIQGRDPISFRPFDGAIIGPAYADATDAMKQDILDLMRADYAGYDVTILSSDESPPPDGPFSIIHFGGYVPGLLGLADTVDSYNADPSQQAIVYLEGFAAYVNMQLSPEEMAVMIANVASHELGHLLGLYHTRDPQDVMDITANAWQLAENQAFRRAPLEPSVFPTGMEDSPGVLGYSVGYNPHSAKFAGQARALHLPKYLALRRMMRAEIASLCGTCRSLNGRP